MRKILGKWGKATGRLILHAATLFLLLSAAFSLAFPEAANAQVLISSGFTVAPGSQTVTATCSTTGVVPTDYYLFLATCAVTPSDGSAVITSTQCPDPLKLSWPKLSDISGPPAEGNPTGKCSIVFQARPGITYTINSGHGVWLNTLSNCYVSFGVEMSCYVDPEGFNAFFFAGKAPYIKTQTSSITYKVISSYPAQEYKLTNTAPLVPVGDSTAVYTAPCLVPTIASISPRTWFAGESYDITITGTGFTTQANATTSCPTTPVVARAASGSSVSLSGVTVVSPTEITATVEPGIDDPTGVAAITVGSSSTGQQTVRTQILGNQIQWNGSTISTTDGSTPPTQTAVVGQQIALTTTTPATTAYDGPTLTPTWTVGGTNIGGYTASTSGASVTPTTLNQSSLTTYWPYAGNNIPVTYQYCANIQGANPVLQCSLPANATFTVTDLGTGTMKVTPYYRVTIADLGACSTYPAGPWLIYAGSATGNCLQLTAIPGVTFNTPTGYPNGQNGVFTVVQVINSNITTGSGPAGNYNIGPWNNELDGPLPYGTFPNKISDSPMTQLTPNYTNVSRTMTATVFLMWQPPSPSITVPLGYQEWTFSGTATCSTNCESAANWNAITNGTPHLIGPFTASDPSQNSVDDSSTNIPLKYGYPIWSGNTDDN